MHLEQQAVSLWQCYTPKASLNTISVTDNKMIVLYLLPIMDIALTN